MLRVHNRLGIVYGGPKERFGVRNKVLVIKLLRVLSLHFPTSDSELPFVGYQKRKKSATLFPIQFSVPSSVFK